MNINNLLNKNLKTLLVTIFNTERINNDFKIVSRFRQTKWSNELLDNKYYKKIQNDMSKYFELEFMFNNKNHEIFTIIHNRNNFTYDEFINLLYFEIIKRISKDISNYEIDLIMGMFSMRGSIDITANFYTIDARIKTENHMDKIYKLILNSEKLFDYLNLNFRQLQEQFITGKNKRDDQIRINLGWLYTYNKYMHLINEYRANALDYQADLKNNIKPPKIESKRNRASFIYRMNYYRKNIFGKELTNENINNMRDDLFGTDGTNIITRNQRIKLFVQETTEDRCVGCNDEYNIKDRSFIMPNNNNHWYLEINHIIPFSNEPEKMDVAENLVKLCPVCHRALAPGRAEIKLQRKIIYNMIHKSRNDVKDFIIKISGTLNDRKMVSYVLNLLK